MDDIFADTEIIYNETDSQWIVVGIRKNCYYDDEKGGNWFIAIVTKQSDYFREKTSDEILNIIDNSHVDDNNKTFVYKEPGKLDLYTVEYNIQEKTHNGSLSDCCLGVYSENNVLKYTLKKCKVNIKAEHVSQSLNFNKCEGEDLWFVRVPVFPNKLWAMIVGAIILN